MVEGLTYYLYILFSLLSFSLVISALSRGAVPSQKSGGIL